MPYTAKNPIRIVTAASLFDGHDASINLMRRLIQDAGAEVIHLGHNRSVLDVVTTALQEGAQGICLSSYQGGHMEYFKYTKDLLKSVGADYVKIFGGGGGVIVHDEKRELEAYGIDYVFHPDDGRKLGLEGMIEIIIKGCDFRLDEVQKDFALKELDRREDLPHRLVGLSLDYIERGEKVPEQLNKSLESFALNRKQEPLVLGVTGTGGAGKSSLVDELVGRMLNFNKDMKVAVVCVDPSKRKTGGALLGDRIRMNSLSRKGTFMRSIASRGSGSEIAASLQPMLNYLKTLDFDLIIAETSGIGQANVAITEVSDLSLYVMTSEFGAQSQLEKIDMIDFADLIAINKADHRGSLDALRDVRKQYKRSRKMFEVEDETLPVFLTQAAQFNDVGCNNLFFGLLEALEPKDNRDGFFAMSSEEKQKIRGVVQQSIIPPERQNYLAEIVRSVRDYKATTEDKAKLASKMGAVELLKSDLEDSSGVEKLQSKLEKEIDATELTSLRSWDDKVEQYKADEFVYQVRGKEIRQPLIVKSLSHTKIRRVEPPKYTDWGDRLRFLRLENYPGQFPYTAGVFPLKRTGEDPIRMFAGEGPPERTNKRFHYLSKEQPAKRLSTAFDSVTLYGHDPDKRPDIYGKVGESGVSICTLNDMKKLYAGFDLCDPMT